MLLSWPGGGTFKIVTILNIQLKMNVAVVYFEDDIVVILVSMKETFAEASNILSAAPFA